MKTKIYSSTGTFILLVLRRRKMYTGTGNYFVSILDPFKKKIYIRNNSTAKKLKNIKSIIYTVSL